MDPMRFLDSEDQVEVLTMQAITQRVFELRAEAQQDS